MATRPHPRPLRPRPLRHVRRLLLESLEPRRLLAIDLTGVPDWIARGPSPSIFGQTEQIDSTGPGENPVVGAIHTLALHPTDSNVAFLGSTNGGIWRSTNFTAANPTYEPLTDQFQSLSNGALEFDPTDPTSNTLVAGVGVYSAFLGNGGDRTGLLKTTDGGDTWFQLGNTAIEGLQGVNVSGVGPRGDTILVSSNSGGVGGVYRSIDGGDSFQLLSGTNGLPTGAVFDLIGDPSNNSLFYVSIAGVGIYRTPDLGDTWVNASDAALTAAFTAGGNNNAEMTVSPQSGRIFAGVLQSGRSIYIGYSDNMGDTWTQMDLPVYLQGAIDVVGATNASPIVVTTASTHAYRNGDLVRISGVLGNTAANGEWFVTNISGTTFSLNGSAGNGAYVASGGDFARELGRLNPSEKPGGQGGTHFSILVDPNDDDIVYVGGDRQDSPFPNPVGATDFTANIFRGDASVLAVAPGALNNEFSPQWEHLTHTQDLGFVGGGTADNSAPHADSREMRFRADGVLIEVDDGGIYGRTSPQDNTGIWFSKISDEAGGLQITEMHDVAYDNNSDIIISGNQDNGNFEEITSGGIVYRAISLGDGGDVAVDNLIGGGNSLRYTSAQNLGGLRRREMNAANGLVSDTNVGLNSGTDPALTPMFVTPIAVNEGAANRLIIGGANGIYESLDRGDNISRIDTNRINGTDGNLGLNDGAPIAYGTADNPDALYVGTGSTVRVRTAAGNPLVAAAATGGGIVRDIEMDPDDFMHAFVIDDNSQVFETFNAGDSWTPITGNLAMPDLRNVEFVPLPGGGGALLVGGRYGVFSMLSTSPGIWAELGANLPNAPVWDMEYDAVDDILVVGTLGRGAWVVENATDVIDDPPVLTICGDENHVNQDDIIRLIRNMANPLLLDVYLNSAAPVFTVPLAALQQINVFGIGGNDTLDVDSSFGLIGVPLGIRYDGDGACPGSQPGFGYDRGFDTLTLSQTAGDTQDSHTYSVGPAAGAGTSVIEGPGGVQTVIFEELEPVLDFVPATELIVNGTGEANLINYVATGFFFALGQITIDNYESITFAQKTGLVINAGEGDDTVILDSPFAPLGLAQIAVNGEGGNDSIVNRSAAPLPQVLSGGLGDDFLVGGPGDNTITGGPGFDTIGILGTPANNVIDVRQDDDATLIATIDGVTRSDTFDAVEAVRVNAGLGDDIIRVAHDDALVASPEDSLPFEVIGGGPSASDRLAVLDDGIGDTVIYRKGADGQSGSVTVGPLAPVRFEQIAFLDVTPLNPVTGGTGSDGNGRLIVFKPDPYENNNSRTAATHLGAGATINVDPVIDPGAFAPLGLPGDEDWFQVVAAETGVLDFQVFFEQVDTLSNGRAGLPGDGDLDIRVYDASGDLIGSSATSSDNERIAIGAVRNETYYLQVLGFDGAVNVYNLTVVNVPAPIPFQVDLQAGSDSGRSDTDDITNDTTATFDVYLDDDRLEEFTNLNLAPGDDYFVELYNNGVLLGVATYQGPSPGVGDNSRWQLTVAPGGLQEGHNNFITAAVRIQDEATPRIFGRGELSTPLQVTLDTVAPAGTAHLFPDSDSGIWGFGETMTDLITSDMTPLLFGAAEANALVRAAIDGVPAGTAVAIPYDGDEAFPPPPEFDGNYFLQTILNLEDGEHTIEVFFQDVAGNESPADEDATLVIFVDTQGPRITNVTRGDVSTDNVHSFDGVTSVFEPKPSDTGPDPLVHSIVIHFSDLPDRTEAFADYHALFLALAEEEGNYSVKGDHNGNIAIVDVNVTFITTPDDGLPEIAQVELVFDQPLPDDRYTVTVSDNLSDAAGNPLDGESGAMGPFEGNDVPDETPPIFPTGDGEHGGSFSARFTIDSRPEIGTYALGTMYIDINGNGSFDPTGEDNDYTNRDIAFVFGFRDDRIFAGNFAPVGAASASGYDKLGGYGTQGQGAAWNWRLDFDHDGVIDYTALSGVQTQGDPVAGNFSAAHPGDEIGLFNAGKWWLDAEGDNNIGGPGDTFLQGNMRGQPIVGDFDGDGLDDLATWDAGNAGTQFDGVFQFDLAFNGLTGNSEATIQFDIPGVFQKAVAADMNEDGIDDIGLFVSRREGVPPSEAAEWFFLISDVALEAHGTVNALNHPFTPVPFGNDLFAQFGDEAALPVVGNFDPPSGPVGNTGNQNPLNPLDVNNDGKVSVFDALLVVNHMNVNGVTSAVTSGIPQAPFLDVNRDVRVSAHDAMLIINHLNALASSAATASAFAEGEADGGADAGEAIDSELLAILADDQESVRRRRG